MKKNFFWSYRAKIFSFAIILVVAVSGFTLANYAMNKYFAFKSHAGIGNAHLFFEPNATTLTPQQTVGLNTWVTVDQGVSQMEITYSFDPRTVYLAGDIIFPNTPFRYKTSNSSLSEINASGHGIITLSMIPIASISATPTGPSPSNVLGVGNIIAPTSTSTPATTKPPTPTPIAPSSVVYALPVGTFKLATFPLRAHKPTISASSFGIDLKVARVVGEDTVPFLLTSEPAKLYLNSPVPPSPSSTPTPPPPTSYPSSSLKSTPTPPHGTCISTLSTIAFASRTNTCNASQALSANYTCSDGFAGNLGDNIICIDTQSLRTQATSRCGSPHPCRTSPSPSPYPTTTAIPKPSVTSVPIPTPTPTPPPTADPSPLVSCALEVYKIPPTISLDAPFLLPQYRLNGTNITVKPGERYVIDMALTNIKPYPLLNGNLKLTTWSVNSQGVKAPYSLFSTHPNACSSYPDKSVRCELPQMLMQKGETIKPQTLMVIDIDKVSKPQSTSITFKGIYSASQVTCPSINLAITPRMIRKCYGWGRFQWCRNVIQ